MDELWKLFCYADWVDESIAQNVTCFRGKSSSDIRRYLYTCFCERSLSEAVSARDIEAPNLSLECIAYSWKMRLSTRERSLPSLEHRLAKALDLWSYFKAAELLNSIGITLDTLASSDGKEQVVRYQEARGRVQGRKPAQIRTPNEAKTLLEWWESRRLSREKAKLSVVEARIREEALAKGLATSTGDVNYLKAAELLNSIGITLDTLASSDGKEQVVRYQEARGRVQGRKPPQVRTPNEATIVLEWWDKLQVKPRPYKLQAKPKPYAAKENDEKKRADKEKEERIARTREEALAKGLATSTGDVNYLKAAELLNSIGITLDTLASSDGKEQVVRYQEARGRVQGVGPAKMPAQIMTPNEATIVLEWWDKLPAEKKSEKKTKKKSKKKSDGAAKDGAAKAENPILAEAAALAALQLEARKAREAKLSCQDLDARCTQ